MIRLLPWMALTALAAAEPSVVVSAVDLDQNWSDTDGVEWCESTQGPRLLPVGLLSYSGHITYVFERT
jgi:hypothetical protein